MIRAVVFDLDDTLASERDYVLACLARMSEDMEEGDGQLLLALARQSVYGVFDRFFAAKGRADDRDAVLAAVCRYRETKVEKLQPYADVVPALSRLIAEGKKLGLITDGRPEAQRDKIRALGIADLFDSIAVTDELGGPQYRKPCAAAFEKTAKDLGVKPEEMLYVGDNPQKDFAVKKSFPVFTAHIAREGALHAGEPFRDGILPDMRIKDLFELAEKIRRDDPS